jgi:hypothetical protein
MDTQIVIVYCLCDDLLKGLQHYEDHQCVLSDAEVMTTAIIASLHFGGNLDKTQRVLHEQGYLARRLSKSRFNRRFHRLAQLFGLLIEVLGDVWKDLNDTAHYVLDSFPVAACDNYRIPRCHLYQGEAWRGYQASKRRYFYGVKIHLMITEYGQPVEFFLTPGADNDPKALKMYRFDLPEGSQVTGDKAYNNYDFEDLLREAGLELCPLRKKNSHRLWPPWVTYLLAKSRKWVETTGSLIERLLPKHIHAVTAAGFELKVALFVLACSLNFLS